MLERGTNLKSYAVTAFLCSVGPHTGLLWHTPMYTSDSCEPNLRGKMKEVKLVEPRRIMLQP